VPALIKALQDKDEYVRVDAEWATDTAEALKAVEGFRQSGIKRFK